MPGWRRNKDRLATIAISAGGAFVLFAILLIFFYLLLEVMPLFRGAHMEKIHDLVVPLSLQEQPVYSAMEEQGEVALIIDGSMQANFLRIADNKIILSADLSNGSNPVTAYASESAHSRLLAFSHADGSIKLLRHEYRLSYPEGVRHITPRLDTIYSGEQLGFSSAIVGPLAVRDGEESLVLAGVLVSGEVVARRY